MKYLNYYHFFSDRVELTLTDGSVWPIYFNEFSGKAYYRYKINTVSGIKHPGICLGNDEAGNHIMAHNHYQYGKPTIVQINEFTQGQEIFSYPEFATNAMLVVIEKALDGVIKGESYTPLSFNCQSYVNEALSNKRRSPAIENSLGGLFFLGLIALGVSLSAE